MTGRYIPWNSLSRFPMRLSVIKPVPSHLSISQFEMATICKLSPAPLQSGLTLTLCFLDYEPSGCNCDNKTEYNKAQINSACTQALNLASQRKTLGRDKYPHAYNGPFPSSHLRPFSTLQTIHFSLTPNAPRLRKIPIFACPKALPRIPYPRIRFLHR